MKKGRLVVFSFCISLLICLLTLSLTFKTICVKTISDNYMNLLTTNQIIDYVIDHFQGMTGSQLEQLQDDLIDSIELYDFNEQAFDQTIYSLENDDNWSISDETVLSFSETCIKYIEKDLKQKLDEQEKQDIKDLLQKDSLWTRFSTNLKSKLNNESIIVHTYKLMNSMIFKIVLGLFVLIGLWTIYHIKKGYRLWCYSTVFLMTSLTDYLMIFVVKVLTPKIAGVLNVTSLSIDMAPVLYCAMIFLTLSLIGIFTSIIRENWHFF